MASFGELWVALGEHLLRMVESLVSSTAHPQKRYMKRVASVWHNFIRDRICLEANIGACFCSGIPMYPFQVGLKGHQQERLPFVGVPLCWPRMHPSGLGFPKGTTVEEKKRRLWLDIGCGFLVGRKNETVVDIGQVEAFAGPAALQHAGH